jgi:YegS/Rv2252/BmrU family lipid kinase
LKVRFIVNPAAGTSKKVEEITGAVRRVFASVRGVFEVRVTGGPGDAFKLSEEACQKGYETVYACGGDGTVNEVAAALVNSRTVLGIIQCGSGNGLARALSIPIDIELAAALPLKGRVRKVDTGVVNEKYFFSTAGFGFDALMSKRYNERVGGRRGILPYVPIALREFFRYRPAATLIKWDDKYMRVFPFLLTVANTDQYGGDWVIAPGAVPDDGLLDLCILHGVGLFGALRYARSLFKGEIDRVKKFKRIRTASVEITRKRPGPVHLDGEPLQLAKSIKIGVLPGALRVWVR